MVYKNRQNKIYLGLILLTFVVFTFGQLLSIYTSISLLRFHLIDLTVFFTSLFFVLNVKKFTFRLKCVFFVFLFGYILSLAFFGFHVESLLYLVRFFNYLLFVESLLYFTQQSEHLKNKITNIIYISGFCICIIGIFQYVFSPDLRYLKMLGWDEHYFRLTFPFLDPSFTGIILVANLFFSLKIKRIFLRNFLFILYIFSILATFSRSSYLSLIIGFLYLSFSFLKKKYLLLIFILSLFLFSVLPKPGGEGVNLFRVNSILAKSVNYNETIEVIKKFPLFGVGYNNLCFVRVDVFKLGNSCFGFDNSLLFVIATSGVLGFFVYMYYLNNIYKNIGNSKIAKTGKMICIIVLIHSLFTNTLFYPWVIVLVGSIIAVSRDKIVRK